MLLFQAAPAVAQTATLRLPQAPYFVGVPINLQIVVDGVEESPQPTLEGAAPGASSFQLRSISPNVSNSITIVNGRMAQQRSVKFVYTYEVLYSQPGRYTVGPFTAEQGAIKVMSRGATLQVGNVPRAGDQKLEIILPEDPVYVGQRFTVKLEWWSEENLKGTLFNPRLEVPLFRRNDMLRFIDPARQQGNPVLPAGTANGTVDLPFTESLRKQDGKSWLVRSIERDAIALTPGTYNIEAAEITLDRGIRFRRDIFGNRTPTHTVKQRAAGLPTNLTVRDVPNAGRPASFSGAIGRGFTLDVSADRTVVTAGDPIRLRLTLRGEGPLDSVSLPPLTVDGGMNPRHFRVPGGKLAGTLEEDSKQFVVSVRALSPEAGEIPPLAFSWFDPSLSRFETTRSRPIALSVKSATVVSAGDVVTAAETAGSEATDSPKPTTPPKQRSASSGRLELSGADLALVTDTERLLHPAGGGGAALQFLGYIGGLLALAGGWFLRRRGQVDPAILERRNSLADIRRQISGAREADKLGEALRALSRLAPDVAREEREAILAECDALAYAPDRSGKLDKAIRKRALQVADQAIAAGDAS